MKTAVEWLENEFKEAHKMFGGIDTNWIKRFEQAKAMEKEQKIEFANKYANSNSFYCSGEFDIEKCAEQYYKETYESTTRI